MIANAHAIAFTLLTVVVVLHVASAVASQFWFSIELLRRMTPGQGRLALSSSATPRGISHPPPSARS